MSVAPIRTLKRNGGGAKITYYDNTTELGYQYVASGQDVLHPTLTMPTKSGKTFVGWSTTTSENNWVGELTANGQPMSLYAIYVDNTRTLSVDNVWLSGATSGNARAAWSTSTEHYYFNLLTKGRYATANCTYSLGGDSHGTGPYMHTGGGNLDGLEGVTITEGYSASKTYTDISIGTHTVEVTAISYNDYWQLVWSSVSITLSNPIAWT